MGKLAGNIFGLFPRTFAMEKSGGERRAESQNGMEEKG